MIKNALFAVSVFQLLALNAGYELYVADSCSPFSADGKYNEYAYVGYDWSESFLVLDRENSVTNGLFEPVGKPFSDLKTQGGVFTDGDNLCVAVLAPCSEQQIPTAGDGAGVAISADGRTLLVAECNLHGKCTVSRIGEDGVRTPLTKSGVKAGVSSGKHSFGVELVIPFDVIGCKPGRQGCVWRCNIYRTGPSCGGMSSWAPVQGDIFNPDRFGRIVFGSRKSGGEVMLPENKGKNIFLWMGERWGGNLSGKPPLDEKETGKILLAGPQGGRAVGHFRVSNLTDHPAIYSLKMENFKQNVFAKRVRFREVGNVELKGGPTVPDPIFDLPNGSVLRIPPQSTAMVWVDVDTEGMNSGVHKAKLVLVPGYSKFEVKTMELELKVGKANIREIDMPCWTYGLRSAESFRRLKDYKFNVSGMITPWFMPKCGADGRRDWSEFDNVIAAMLESGIQADEVRILVYTLFPRWQNPRKFPKCEKEIVDGMRAGIEYAQKRYGIGLDRIWLSTVDEPHGDPDDPQTTASHAFYGARLAKKIHPELKSWTNPYKAEEVQYLSRYLEEFDALTPFLPVVNKYDSQASERYVKSGKDVWSYTIYLKQNRPVQYRGISWKNFEYGFEGPATFYTLYHMSGDGFNSYDEKGSPDYGVLYSDKRTGEVIVSLRLEAWYQGHIEQRLLKWCRNRISKMADNQKAERCRHRLKGLVKRAVAPRPNFDLISRELLDFSDELAE